MVRSVSHAPEYAWWTAACKSFLCGGHDSAPPIGKMKQVEVAPALKPLRQIAPAPKLQSMWRLIGHRLTQRASVRKPATWNLYDFSQQLRGMVVACVAVSGWSIFKCPSSPGKEWEMSIHLYLTCFLNCWTCHYIMWCIWNVISYCIIQTVTCTYIHKHICTYRQTYRHSTYICTHTFEW